MPWVCYTLIMDTSKTIEIGDLVRIIPSDSRKPNYSGVYLVQNINFQWIRIIMPHGLVGFNQENIKLASKAL